MKNNLKLKIMEKETIYLVDDEYEDKNMVKAFNLLLEEMELQDKYYIDAYPYDFTKIFSDQFQHIFEIIKKMKVRLLVFDIYFEDYDEMVNLFAEPEYINELIALKIELVLLTKGDDPILAQLAEKYQVSLLKKPLGIPSISLLKDKLGKKF